MTIDEIKALPRDKEGRFVLEGIDANLYLAAAAVYPPYAEYETKENKKAGYLDILTQVRSLNDALQADFSFANAVYFAQALLGTIDATSPEIYENYREMQDMLRALVHRVIESYYDTQAQAFTGDAADVALFQATLRKACDEEHLLAEKYEGYAAK